MDNSGPLPSNLRSADLLREYATLLVIFGCVFSGNSAAGMIDHVYYRSDENREVNVVTRAPIVIERNNAGRGGIPFGKLHDVTEQWVREFFGDPKRHLEILGIEASCLKDTSCLASVDELLQKNKGVWRRSAERGKILVGLTYVLGNSILLQRPELDWVIIVDSGFVYDIGLGNEEFALSLFTRVARPNETFILEESGIDMLTWMRLLESQPLSRIEKELSTKDFMIQK